MNIKLDGLNNYLANFNAILVSGPSVGILAQDIFFELKNSSPDTDVGFIDLCCSTQDLTKELNKLLTVSYKTTVILASNASNMSTSVANKLLKIVEEPPTNIKFVFLADNLSRVLPTIVSRCVMLPQRDLLAQIDCDDVGCKDNPICRFFSREFSEQDLPTLLQVIACESVEPPQDAFEHVLINAKRHNNCPHALYKCEFFCRLESACKNVAKARPNCTSSKLIWQAIFCQTLAYK